MMVGAAYTRTPCPVCGINVTRFNKYYPYCTGQCKRKAEKQMIKKTCDVCGNGFDTNQPGQKYCSKECIKTAASLRAKPPSILIKETNIFLLYKRDNFKCVYCGASAHDGAELHVDHIYPLNKGCENDIFNLVTSCKQCNIVKKDMLLPQEKILELWERNAELDRKSGLIMSYEELKLVFNKMYRTKTKRP